jgi:hypothetical protein
MGDGAILPYVLMACPELSYLYCGKSYMHATQQTVYLESLKLNIKQGKTQMKVH